MSTPAHARRFPGHPFSLVLLLLSACLAGCGGGGEGTQAASTLESISVQPDLILFQEAGASRQLAVTGVYTDGSRRDLTASATGTTYQVSDPGVATASGDGLVTAVGTGSCVLTVSHAGSSRTVAVEVADAAGREAADVLGYVPGEVIVVLAPGATAQTVAGNHDLEVLGENTLSALGFTLARFAVPAGRDLDQVVDALLADPDVQQASKNIVFRSQKTYDDPLAYDAPDGQYGLYLIRADEAHDLATGAGVRVAVIDSGLDLGHEEFAGQVVAAYNAVDHTGDVTDFNGHGTHVAGTIAARADNGAGVVGIAPDAELIIARSGSAGTHTAYSVVEAMDFAVAQGARVMNMSLGVGLPTPDSDSLTQYFFRTAVDAAVRAGVVVVASAGNDQQRGSPYGVPALLPDVIAVAAVDSDREVTDFSNLRPYVDVAAPGKAIWSAWPRDLGNRTGYRAVQGTSMAAPHVAGVAALVLEANPALTPCEVQAIIEGTAVDLGAPGKDPRYGSGLVDARAAVEAALASRDDPDGVLGASCRLAVVSGETGADVFGVAIDPDSRVVQATPLNADPAPWDQATSVAADAAGNLYVTAVGGFGEGVYRVNGDGTVDAVAVGAPFERPEGLTVNRDSDVVAVDSATARIVRISPDGDVHVLHTGAPLTAPTGIDDGKYGGMYYLTDYAPATGTGGIYRFDEEDRSLEMLASGGEDYADVAANLLSGLRLAIVSPRGGEDGGGLTLWMTTWSEPRPGDLTIPGSTEGLQGIGLSFANDLWVTDNGGAEAVLVHLATDPAGGVSRVTSVRTDAFVDPVDVAQIPPRVGPVALPETVFLSTTSLYLDGAGDTGVLEVLGRDSDMTLLETGERLDNDGLSFRSLDEAVATVSEDGVVTATAPGVARIEITAGDIQGTAFVYVGLERVAICHPADGDGAFDPDGGWVDTGDFAVPEGQEPISVYVAAFFSDGSTRWISNPVWGTTYASNNRRVVLPGTVQMPNALTFLHAGEATLTARNGPFTDSVDVVVGGDDPILLEGISVREDRLELRVGETGSPTVMFTLGGEAGRVPLAGSGSTFTSSAPGVASVDPLSGVVTGVSPGTAVVTVRNGPYEATVPVVVAAANQLPRGVILQPDREVTVHAGDTVAFTGRASDPDGSVALALWTFGGAAPNRAGEDGGAVAFPEPGTVVVTFVVTDDEGGRDPAPDTRTVTVLAPDVTLESIEIVNDAVALDAGGDTEPLRVVGLFSDGETYDLTARASGTTYTSSDEGVVTVSPDGLATAVAGGTATITAANGGRTASVQVRVQASGAPTASLGADPASIYEAHASTLSWSTTGADTVTLEPGPGAVDPTGSVVVFPAETTTYTLTATGSGGTATATATVTVTPYPAPTASITVEPATITAGESAVVSWTSTDAVEAALAPGFGMVDPSGSVTVSPTETTTYTFTAGSPGGTASDWVTLTVLPVQPTPTAELTAEPAALTEGGSAALSWATTDADTVTIEPDVGAVDPSGSVAVSPAETTTYTLTAIGPGGTATDAVTITVTPAGPPPGVRLLPDTGQTDSYTDLFGEDSDYEINPPSCTDNEDGTVTDNVTGLVWQQDGENPVGYDLDAAVRFCEDLELGGHGDWRVPSLGELLTTVDYGLWNPAADPSCFTGFRRNSYYFTSTSTVDPSWSRRVVLALNPMYGIVETGGSSVRCVREEQPQVPEGLMDNGNGTVTDLATGLVWQQGETDEYVSWTDALAYCEDLVLADEDDWRLPNIRELYTLVDLSFDSPKISTTHFPGVHLDLAVQYITSTTCAWLPSYAWTVGFAGTSDTGAIQKEGGRGWVRCVRGGRTAPEEGCSGFVGVAPDLDMSAEFSPGGTAVAFTYTPGPEHSTDVSFDLYLNGVHIDSVEAVPPGGESGPIPLPDNLIVQGGNEVYLRNPTCPPGVGSCTDGRLQSWAGTVCFPPREPVEAIWFEKEAPDLDFSTPFTAGPAPVDLSVRPGPEWCTRVTFGVYVNGAFVTTLEVAPGAGPDEVTLPSVDGGNTLEFRDPTCPEGDGCCADGQVSSWAGTVFLRP